MEFKEKVVLIVGASSGIGRAISLKLAAAGATVVVTARRKDKLDDLAEEITRKGGRCLALAADALDEKAAAKVVTTTVDKFGRIDLALLNAGGAPAIDMRKMNAAEVKYYMADQLRRHCELPVPRARADEAAAGRACGSYKFIGRFSRYSHAGSLFRREGCRAVAVRHLSPGIR